MYPDERCVLEIHSLWAPRSNIKLVDRYQLSPSVPDTHANERTRESPVNSCFLASGFGLRIEDMTLLIESGRMDLIYLRFRRGIEWIKWIGPVMSLNLIADQSQRKSAWTGIAVWLLWQLNFRGLLKLFGYCICNNSASCYTLHWKFIPSSRYYPSYLPSNPVSSESYVPLENIDAIPQRHVLIPYTDAIYCVP